MYQSEYMTIYPMDVFAATDKGVAELNRGSTALSATEIELLVLMDGKSELQELVKRAPHIEEDDFWILIPKLIRDGYAAKASFEVQDDLDFSYFFDAEKTVPSAEAQQQAQKEAEAGTHALNRDGYYVSIARRSARARPTAGGRMSVLVVEDDPQVTILLAHALKQEGFEVRTAANRADVVAGLRFVPSPDLVLLDVTLPDANGFDILERMKQHPVLKAIPVIMLTGAASRESVIRGLAEGADGYITKPFELAILRSAVKFVLGLD